jgi:hypothetical protein
MVKTLLFVEFFNVICSFWNGKGQRGVQHSLFGDRVTTVTHFLIISVNRIHRCDISLTIFKFVKQDLIEPLSRAINLRIHFRSRADHFQTGIYGRTSQ